MQNPAKGAVVDVLVATKPHLGRSSTLQLPINLAGTSQSLTLTILNLFST